MLINTLDYSKNLIKSKKPAKLDAIISIIILFVLLLTDRHN